MAYTNIEDRRENKRIYYLNHRDTILARAIKWNKDNHEHYLASSRKYHRKEKGVWAQLKYNVLNFFNIVTVWK